MCCVSYLNIISMITIPRVKTVYTECVAPEFLFALVVQHLVTNKLFRLFIQLQDRCLTKDLSVRIIL